MMLIVFFLVVALTFGYLYKRGLRKRYGFLLFVIGLLLASSFYLFEKGDQASEALHNKAHVHEELSNFGAELEKVMSRKFMLLHGMTVFIRNNPSFSEDQFNNMAMGLLNESSLMVNLAAAPDLIVRHVYPLEGNKKVLGLDYMKTLNQKESVILCKEANRIITSGPVELVQGGEALILRAPVWLSQKKNRQFWGIISSAIPINKLLDEILDKSPLHTTHWGLKGKDALGDQGEWIVGEKFSLDQDITTRVELPLPHGSWVLYGKPKETDQTNHYFGPWVLAIVIFLLFAYGFWKSHDYQQKISLSNQRLSSSEHLFKEMFLSAPIGIALCDMNGKLFRTNDAYNKIIGYTPNEVLELTYWEITPKEYEEQEAFQLKALEDTGYYGPYQKKYLHKSGDQRDVLLNGFTVAHEGQSVIWSFVEDITVRVNANQLLKDEKEKAEMASRAKTEFLSMMSHEIRTPMNGIIGAADLLSYCDLPKQENDYLALIKKSSDFMLKILNNLLDVAKLERGSLHIELIPTSLKGQFEECETILRPLASEKSLQLNLSVDSIFEKPIMCDPTRLNQVVINLGSNAIKFTSKGEVSIKAFVKENTIQVDVTDTGIGMTEDQMNKIFEPFVQADLSTTRHYGGTGLGLSISRSIAKAMGGQIHVQSEVEKGSSFSFTLPLLWTEEGHELPIEDTPILPLKGAVLLVEDTDSNRQVNQALLEKFGLKVDSVVNGMEALTDYNIEHHDLILMDIQMPVMDGLESLKALREKGCNCPIIAITSNIFEDDIVRYRKAGFNDYLPKPIDPSHLRKVLERHLPS